MLLVRFESIASYNVRPKDSDLLAALIILVYGILTRSPRSLVAPTIHRSNTSIAPIDNPHFT